MEWTCEAPITGVERNCGGRIAGVERNCGALKADVERTCGAPQAGVERSCETLRIWGGHVLKSHPLHTVHGISYNRVMYTILRSATFDRWLRRLRDRQGVNRIVARLLAAEDGHLGDVRPVGDGVSEMRTQHGPGYQSTSSHEALS